MQWRTLKFLFGMVLALSIMFFGNFGYAAMETTIEKILADKNSYDGKEVLVSGVVSNLKFKKSTGGNEYTTFSLTSESGKSIHVFFLGHFKLKSRQKVNVVGIFRKDAKVGRSTLHNEIEATEIR
jgi:hypothetical protein